MDEIRLIFNNVSYLVLAHSFGSDQAGENGKVTGNPILSPIWLRVEFQEDTHIPKWAWTSRKKYTATLDFISNGTTVMQLEIKDGIATKYACKSHFGTNPDGTPLASIVEEATIVSPEVNWNGGANLKRSS